MHWKYGNCIKKNNTNFFSASKMHFLGKLKDDYRSGILYSFEHCFDGRDSSVLRDICTKCFNTRCYIFQCETSYYKIDSE